jgi:enoyl-CoA hydratase/carnithine racemase
MSSNSDPAPEPSIRCESVARADGACVAGITIDNPGKINVLTGALVAELRDAAGELAALDLETARAFLTGLHEACAARRALPVPVIARIEGHCLGAGLEVAASCDLRVAGRGRSLRHARRGRILPADGGR